MCDYPGPWRPVTKTAKQLSKYLVLLLELYPKPPIWEAGIVDLEVAAQRGIIVVDGIVLGLHSLAAWGSYSNHLVFSQPFWKEPGYFENAMITLHSAAELTPLPHSPHIGKQDLLMKEKQHTKEKHKLLTYCIAKFSSKKYLSCLEHCL